MWWTWLPGYGHGSLWLQRREGEGHCLEVRSRNCEEIMVGHLHAVQVSFRTRTGNEVDRKTRLQRPHWMQENITGCRKMATQPHLACPGPLPLLFLPVLASSHLPPTPSYSAFQIRKAGKKARRNVLLFPSSALHASWATAEQSGPTACNTGEEIKARI